MTQTPEHENKSLAPEGDKTRPQRVHITEHKHGGLGQLPATAICGNDITSSCLYVSALSIVYAGRWAPVALLLVSAVLFLPLSILLLLAAIRLLGRRRTGVSMHKTWAVLRLVMVVISVVVGILMLPTSIQFERSMQEATVRLARERGSNVPDRPFDEDFAWKKGVVMTGVSAGVFSVYPLFLGFYLSRRKIGDEVETWA